MKTRIRQDKSQIKSKTFLNYPKKKTKKKILNHKTKNKTLVVQKGGNDPTNFNKGDFETLCKKKMGILTPQDLVGMNRKCEEKYSEAEKIFMDFNYSNNRKFFLPLFSYHVGGSILYSAEPGPGAEPQPQGDKDLNNYYHCLRKTVRQLSNTKTNRKIFFLKAHSSYGNEYFILPKNITVCFLTAVNKYGFTEFQGKKNIFSPYFGLGERKSFFNSIFANHANYFDREEFYCDRHAAYHIKMDYFRESTWYFPGQLCTNSGLQMNREEYEKGDNTFGFTSVNESNYLETKDQIVVDNHFLDNPRTIFYTRLKELIQSGFFEPHLHYILILDGCRMFKYSDSRFNFDSQYNFIHYHITQKVCRDLKQPETTPFITIPDYTVCARARNYLLKGVIIDDDLEVLQRQSTYNYFSFNNHLLDYLLEKLEQPMYQNDKFYHSFKWFAYTLDYEKMIYLYYKLIERGKSETVIRKIMNTDMLNFKFDMIVYMLDSLIGDSPDAYTLYEKFNSKIVVALMNRTERFRELLTLLSQNEILSSFNSRLPIFSGINFFNNSILYQSGETIINKGLKPSSSQTLITRVNNNLLRNVIDILRSCVPQKRVVFYGCVFTGSLVNFKNKEISHLCLVKCLGYNYNTINSVTKTLEIHHNDEILSSVFDVSQIESMIITQIQTSSLLIRGSVLTFLELELKHTSTIMPDFQCPKLKVFKLKFDKMTNLPDFSLKSSMYLEDLSLYNIDFGDEENQQPRNKVWDFNNFRLLKKLTLENFIFNKKKSVFTSLRNLEFISFRAVINLEANELPKFLLRTKKIKNLYLQFISDFGEVTDEFIQLLLRNKVDVDTDETIERLMYFNLF